MNGIFVNGSYGVEECGVHQYGTALFSILKDSDKISWNYIEPKSFEQLKSFYTEGDFILYNWQSGQGGFLIDSPFSSLGKQALVFHDCIVNDRFDAVLFSDPTMKDSGKWRSIGRPIPIYTPQRNSVFSSEFPNPVVGVHGFIGAWADQVVHRVMQEFEVATVRLSLPYAAYGDSHGVAARTMAQRCQSMVSNSGIVLTISHDFMPKAELIEWLHANDLNCYIRPADMQWRGVSSAPDSAIAAKKPMAINKCNAFRHLHNLNPSICVEDVSLWDIIGNGLSPFVQLYSDWSPERIREQVEVVMFSL